MAIELCRIDDRLIHGQVVVGWGQPLDVGFIVLVDDEVAASDWEQELYRMGVPPEMEVFFHDVAGAAREKQAECAERAWHQEQPLPGHVGPLSVNFRKHGSKGYRPADQAIPTATSRRR